MPVLVRKGIIGRKLGMTQVFDGDGRMVPVTVIEAGPCLVVHKRTPERDGYGAVQVGFGETREQRLNRPELGHLRRAGVRPLKHLREFRVADPGQFQVGQEIKVDIFEPGELVDVTGTSRGRGFAGAIKRHGLRRGPMSHGSKYHRRVGSLGASTYPARVFKGKPMPGRLGGRRVTVLGLSVVRVDPERNLLLVKGAVPGVRGSLLTIRSSVKAGRGNGGA